jgi:hypothetical protein
MEKREYIISWCNQYNYAYIELDNYDNVYYLLKNGNVNQTDDCNELLYYGNYYNRVKLDYEKMKYYYLMAINKGNVDSLHNLGDYYHYIEKDYEKMKHYYLMGIENKQSLGNLHCMNNLALYYQNIEKDYVKMKHYYLMAIEKKNIISISNLAHYYTTVENDFDKMKYYYKMIFDIFDYDYIISKNEKVFKNYIKYIFDEFDFTIDTKIISLLTLYDNNFINEYLKYLCIFNETLFTDNYKYLNKLNKKKYYIHMNNLNNNIKECNICLITKNNIKLHNCSNELCLSCMNKVNKCPFCRKLI